tara:strand:- start:989 stop:1384 length:396 start_codon:yes stop_codon:yes gene_type:complete
MKFKTPKAALEHVKILCNKTLRNEICGFLGYCVEDNTFVVQETDNIADDPKSFFLIDPLEYLLFKEDYSLIALYHSHVAGDEEPSDFDIQMSENVCLPFLIFSLNTQKIHIYEPQNLDSDVNTLERIKALI